MNVLVVGASRGIGFEFVRQYRADNAQVTATARDAAALARLAGLGAAAIEVDVAVAESVARLAWQIDGASFDVVVVCAGVYGPRTSGLEPPPQADFDAVMHTNVLGPMRVIAQVAEALVKGGKLVVLSSRMGAIGGRTGSEGWTYRASKAAVNSVLKDVSLQLATRAVCVSLHPGWVRTEMGTSAAHLSVEDSVSSMRRVIAKLGSDDNGTFLNVDGAAIDW